MSAYSDLVLAAQPYFYWRFGDASKAQTATVVDSSGNGHSGNYWSGMSSGTSLVAGDKDPSATFTQTITGNGGTAEIYSGPTMVISGAKITIESLCIRTAIGTATNPIAIVFSQSSVPISGTTGAYCFWGGSFGFGFRDVVFSPHGNNAGTNGVWANALPAGPNSDGTGVIIHQVLTFDDTAHSAELFINGVSQGLKTGLKAAGTTDQADLRLGGWPAANNYFNYPWIGSLDEFAVYQYILTPQQIAAHANAAISGYYPSFMKMM